MSALTSLLGLSVSTLLPKPAGQLCCPLHNPQDFGHVITFLEGPILLSEPSLGLITPQGSVTEPSLTLTHQDLSLLCVLRPFIGLNHKLSCDISGAVALYLKFLDLRCHMILTYPAQS